MPMSSWSEWLKVGFPTLVGGVALVGAAEVGAFSKFPFWGPLLEGVGWIAIVFGLACLLYTAAQVRHLPFLAERRERIKRAAEDASLGFDMIENSVFLEGELRGGRIRLRPKGLIAEALLRVEFDASLTGVRWRVEGRPEGLRRGLRVDLAEHEITDHAARAIEIPLNGPPSLDRDTDVIIEVLGPDPVRVTHVRRSMD